MSKRVLWNAPHLRLSLIPLALAALLAIAGCGGGGGGSSTTTTTTTGSTGSAALAIVTGKVTDTTAAATPVPGAVVSIANTSLSATTAADGTFSIVNVPVGTVGLSVLRPSGGQYLGYVLYNGGQYDSQACPIQLTTKASGTSKTPTTLAANLQLYPAGSGPPAPPLTGANGCPQ